MSQKRKLKILPKENYLAFIKNSVGSKSFSNFYAIVDGKKKDILGSGDLSCAYFVSTVLKTFNLIKELHMTVDGTVRALRSPKFTKTSKPLPGDIIVWESKNFNSGLHKHIGFCIDSNNAVSTDYKTGMVAHHMLYDKDRKIEAMFRPKL